MSGTKRQWLVGSTVVLKITVTDPESSVLTDPEAVVVSSLRIGTTEITPVPTVTPVSTGTYRVSIDTDGFLPGTYHWTVVATNADGEKALAQDYFVLAAV